MRYWFIAAILGLGNFCFGTKIIALNLKDLVSESHFIFEGVCQDATAVRIHRSESSIQIPAVRYRFKVLDAIKGVDQDLFEFHQLGTSSGQAKFRVNADTIGIPKYQVGQTYLLFLNPMNDSGLTSPLGLSQGLFILKAKKAFFNGVSNRHIFTKMEPWIPKAKDWNENGVPPEQLKALIRGILSGRIQAKSRKEFSR